MNSCQLPAFAATIFVGGVKVLLAQSCLGKSHGKVRQNKNVRNKTNGCLTNPKKPKKKYVQKKWYLTNQPTNFCGCAAPLIAASWLEPLRQKVQDLSGGKLSGWCLNRFFLSVGNFQGPKKLGEMESI